MIKNPEYSGAFKWISIVQPQTQNGGEYPATIHAFIKQGQYIVRVERTNESGFPAIGHLQVIINE